MPLPGSIPVASGEYKEIVPDKKIMPTFRWDAWPMEMGATNVTVELTEKDGGTELTLVHEDLSSDESVQNNEWNTALYQCVRLNSDCKVALEALLSVLQ